MGPEFLVEIFSESLLTAGTLTLRRRCLSGVLTQSIPVHWSV